MHIVRDGLISPSLQEVKKIHETSPSRKMLTMITFTHSYGPNKTHQIKRMNEMLSLSVSFVDVITPLNPVSLYSVVLTEQVL